MTTVYVTRRALTQGIEKVSHGHVATTCATMFVVPRQYGDECVHKPDWHTSLSEALLRARLMRIKKIASLEKSLARVRALVFDAEHVKE